MFKLKLLTDPNNPYCRKFSMLCYSLEDLELFEEWELGSDFTEEDLRETYGENVTLPQVFYSEKCGVPHGSTDEDCGWIHIGDLKQALNYLECHGRLVAREE